MANNENAFQIALKDQAIKEGANAMRVRHFSLGGIPDLYIKLPMHDATWIECKFERKQPKRGTNITTPLQHAWLTKERESGGKAGWCLCIRISSSKWEIYAGISREFDAIRHFMCDRERGEIWDVIRIINHIHNQQHEANHYGRRVHKV